MALVITSLNSGSNGNCYYVGNEHEAVLIDAGISCRETEKRMLRLGLSMRLVQAIFITHEHSDHINGVTMLAKKHKLPVYITPITQQRGGLVLDESRVHSFGPFETINIGALAVTAFPKMHDAGNPHSFVVACNGVKVGVITDIGIACDQVVHHFSQCHAVFLEANYDEDMLESGNYPYHLKRRIRGGEGHISNRQALALFNTHRSAFLSHLILSHLSKNNNDPDLVKRLFDEHANGVHIVVASRYEETPVYHIGGAEPVNVYKEAQTAYVQASLF